MAEIDQFTTVSDPASLLKNSFLLELYAYWNTCRGDKQVLDRSDIDPMSIPTLLPHLYITDVLPDGEFRVRLIGTHLVERLGQDTTGLTISEIITGTYLNYVHSFLQAAVDSRTPVFCESNFFIPGKDYHRVKRLILPMTHGGEEIAFLLIGQEFLDWNNGDTTKYRTILDEARHKGVERVLIKP